MSRQLGEIRHAEGLDFDGGIVERTAVRAVALRGRHLLLLHSTRNSDYKFPGGGVETGETLDTALRREMAEECGVQLSRIGEELGSIVEYSPAQDEGAAVFKMVSHYVQCQVDGEFGNQDLEDYEQELGLTPGWVDVAEALRANEKALRAEEAGDPVPWRLREILALRFIESELLETPPR